MAPGVGKGGIQPGIRMPPLSVIERREAVGKINFTCGSAAWKQTLDAL